MVNKINQKHGYSNIQHREYRNTKITNGPKIIHPKSDDRDVLHYIPLGGLEEIGRNMSVFEYKDEIVIFDMGLQFPEEDTPGIDFIIPNIEGILKKKDKIKAIIITHGHFDHIGAIPYLMDKLGINIPIYTAAFTKEIINKRQEDFFNAGKLNINVVSPGDEIKLSKYFTAKFFGASHTIPDAVSIILKTPVGNMAYCSDLKIERDINGNSQDSDIYQAVQKENIHTLFLESTNAEKAGKSISETLVTKNIDELFAKANGRIIVGIFASLLTRIVDILAIAEKHNKKVILSGLALKTNVQVAQKLGYLKVKKDTFISREEMHKYKDDKIFILSTGAQGEPNASLMKIINGENKYISIKQGDTVIFSASTIPGNEKPIQSLKDTLTRQGARVYQTQHIDIHASGHGPAEDLKLVMQLIKPKFFVPIHGMYFMRSANTRLAEEVGIPVKNSFLIDNGQIINIYSDQITLSNQTVPAYYVMVDGLGVGDVEEVVVRDRVFLSQEGMIVIITTLDRRTGKFLKNPDIISRGFIYLKENKPLVEEVRAKIKNIVAKVPRLQSIESEYLKNMIRDQIGQYIFNKTKRRPMILPVIIEV